MNEVAEFLRPDVWRDETSGRRHVQLRHLEKVTMTV